MSEARINRISNEKGDGGPSLSGITTFSGLNYFVPPKGTTAERPSDCPPGSIRFNTDSAHLEYFDGLQWLEFEATNDELGVNGALGYRGGLVGGFGSSPNNPTDTIDYITISTLGNALDFGNIAGATRRDSLACLSSRTRVVHCGGNNSSSNAVDNIEYFTIASTGDSLNFGGLLNSGQKFPAACSDGVRGLIGGGYNGTDYTNVISYITITNTASSVDFGDLTSPGSEASAVSSSTRGIWANYYESPTFYNVIQYVTISTLGNAQDFGDMTTKRHSAGGASNATRGVFGGGYTPGDTNSIEFITLSTLGNSQDFGDLTQARNQVGACSSPIRAVWMGGQASSTHVNTMDYVDLPSTGNALDFGDLSVARRRVCAAGWSNGHGGL